MANARNLPSPIDPKKEPITIAVLSGKLESLFKNVKELVTSTARGTENVLRKEMHEVEKRLDEKIDGVRIELKEEIKQVATNLSETEKRLSDKIDRNGKKLDDHETRITTLETARL